MSGRPTARITRDDIESKLREIRGELEQAGESARSVGATVGVVAGVVALLLAFLLGKRRGRRKSTTVEIRRV